MSEHDERMSEHDEGMNEHDESESGEKVFKRNDLVAAVAERTGLPRAKALAAIDAVFETVSHQLKAGLEVRLVGFGSFNVRDRKAGKGRDPRSGAEIDIPEGKSIRFKPGKTLKDTVGSPALETAGA